MVVVFDTEEVFGRGVCHLLSEEYPTRLGRSAEDVSDAQVVVAVVRGAQASWYEPWLTRRTGKLALILAECAAARGLALIRTLRPEAILQSSASAAMIHDCMRHIYGGRDFLDPSVAWTLLRKDPAPFDAYMLSSKEREIAEMLLLGWSNKQIAAAMSCSVSTVKTHVSNILKKTHAGSRAGAVLALLGRTCTKD